MKKSVKKVSSIVLSFVIMILVLLSNTLNSMALGHVNTSSHANKNSIISETTISSTGEVNENTTEFAGGTGVESDPYLIETKEHLNNVRKYPTCHYLMIDDIVFTEADFSETGDYYNGGNGWLHIGGGYSNCFTGVFDGNGHTITGLYENITNTAYGFTAGLFGFVYNGVIKNLGMIDCNITIDYTFSMANAGSIVGILEGGSITNCYNTGNISTSSNDASHCMSGGIVGDARGSITNCYNTGNITATGSYSNAGGITGSISTISFCYNTGSVTASSYGNAKAGGISGQVDFIDNCYNTGNISASCSAQNSYSGGISGTGGEFRNCYNTGEISSSASVGISYAGGISGYISTEVSYYGSLTNCYYLNTIDKGTNNLPDTAISLTIDEMKQQSMFKGFNFGWVWTMSGNPNYYNPELVEDPKFVSQVVGDINGDNTVNPLDISFLSRYISQWSGYSFEINLIEANCDLNGDENVNPLDSTILTRHIANWSNYSHLPLTLS